MTRANCLKALEAFSKRVYRFAETSEVPTFGETPKGNVCVVLSVEGRFGVADDLFEAIRVLGGFKLPRTAHQPEGDA